MQQQLYQFYILGHLADSFVQSDLQEFIHPQSLPKQP